MSTLQRYHSDFYVYLFSNASPNLYPDNTASRFTTELHTPIEFGDVGNWEVGLSELLIPSTYYNITDGANIVSVLSSKAFREAAAVRMASKKRPSSDEQSAAPPVVKPKK